MFHLCSTHYVSRKFEKKKSDFRDFYVKIALRSGIFSIILHRWKDKKEILRNPSVRTDSFKISSAKLS